LKKASNYKKSEMKGFPNGKVKNMKKIRRGQFGKNISVILLVISVLSTFVLAGCGAAKTTTSTATSSSTIEYPSSLNKTVVLRVAATGWDSYNQLLIAAGLDDTPYTVEYAVFQGGNLCLEAVAADKIDFTGTSEIPPIAASLASNGGNFKIVAVSNSSPQNQELVTMGTSGIKSVADLKGKKVGYIKNTTAHYFLSQMLTTAGLKWSDIIPVEITTADGVTALKAGSIDAFASYGNSINAAKNIGAVTLQSALRILSGNFPFVVSDKALADANKRAAAADYLARLQKANEWQKNNLEKWAQISSDPTGQTYEDALALLKVTYSDFDTSVKTVDDSVINSEQSVADTFYDLGLYTVKVDASKLYDKSFTSDYTSALSKFK